MAPYDILSFLEWFELSSDMIMCNTNKQIFNCFAIVGI